MMNAPFTVGVIGAGSWGTALALVLAGKGINVRLWGHRKEHVAELEHHRENLTYLPGFSLPANIQPTDDIQEAAFDAAFLVMVVPSHGFREVFRKLVPFLRKGSRVISATKGIENQTLLTMTQVMAEEAGDLDLVSGALSGPSFAREVAQGQPTAVTVAARTLEEAALFQDLFFTERFRVYGSTDVVGVELGGALKNVIAIAAGIAEGLGYGTNTRAALITRGLAEISRLGVKMGARPLTFSGLAGMGDLVLTCTGELSRNRSVGIKLGEGMQLEEILAGMEMVAEGVKTTRSAMALARSQGVEMPILEQVYQVLYQGKSCTEAVSSLLSRDQRQEGAADHDV